MDRLTSKTRAQPSLQPGAPVEVWAEGAGRWCAGHVMEPVHEGRYTVQFYLSDGALYQKHPRYSARELRRVLRPGADADSGTAIWRQGHSVAEDDGGLVASLRGSWRTPGGGAVRVEAGRASCREWEARVEAWGGGRVAVYSGWYGLAGSWAMLGELDGPDRMRWAPDGGAWTRAAAPEPPRGATPTRRRRPSSAAIAGGRRGTELVPVDAAAAGGRRMEEAQDSAPGLPGGPSGAEAARIEDVEVVMQMPPDDAAPPDGGDDTVSPLPMTMSRRARRHAPAAQSSIREDGVYVPGTAGMAQLRLRNATNLFEAHEWKRRQFEEHPASWRFLQEGILRFGDELGDGFRARFSVEVLLVDAHVDEVLRAFLRSVEAELEAAGFRPLPPGAPEERTLATAKKHVRVVAKAVTAVFGGLPKVDPALAPGRSRLRPPPEDAPIGEFLGGPLVGRAEPGAGICRHRAIVMKYACDALRVAECALVSGVLTPAGMVSNFGTARPGTKVEDHMWNVVRICGQCFLVDCSTSGSRLCQTASLLTDAYSFSYHRAGGHSGLRSLDEEAMRQRRQSGRRASLDVLTAEEGTQEEWFELLKQNLESFGQVEVFRPLEPCFCMHCAVSVNGPCVKVSSCCHRFHVACLNEVWDTGVCPVCRAPFALVSPV